MKKSLLITGGSGYLGKSLISALSSTYNVVVLQNRKKFNVAKNKVKVVDGSLENIANWEKNLANIDIVIHLAGVTHSRDPEVYKKINTIGTENLVKYCKKYRIKQFVYISTRAIGRKCGAYGESKMMAEEIIKKSGIKYTILRVAEAYDENFETREGLGNLMSLISKSFMVPYPAGSSIKLAPVHKDDVIASIIATLGNSKAYFKTYTIAGPENLSFKQVEIRLAQQKDLSRVYIPIPIGLFKPIFYSTSGFLKIPATDQLKRLLGEKDGLSQNVAIDLKIYPRKFLVD